MSKTLTVIPARMDSKRLPGKPMLDVCGRPLVWHTYQRAVEASDYVVVATPDRKIARYCEEHDMRWRPTSEYAPNGTARVAEVWKDIQPKMKLEISHVLNWQVDEPLVPSGRVRCLTEFDDTWSIRTLVAPLEDDHVSDASVVKAVSVPQPGGYWCPWFSRIAVPGSMAHCGVYCFTPDILEHVSILQEHEVAKRESLEQLTWLADGIAIQAIPLVRLPLSINTEQDLEKLRVALLKKA